MPAFVDDVDREGGRVMIDLHAPPSHVAGNVVDAIRNSSPEFGNDEVVHANGLGRTLRPPFTPAFLKSPTSSFFFVSTEIAGLFEASASSPDHWWNGIACRDRHGSILARLAIGLQAVIELVQEFTHQCAVDLMAHAV